jgi:hypothetical protein
MQRIDNTAVWRSNLIEIKVRAVPQERRLSAVFTLNRYVQSIYIFTTDFGSRIMDLQRQVEELEVCHDSRSTRACGLVTQAHRSNSRMASQWPRKHI